MMIVCHWFLAVTPYNVPLHSTRCCSRSPPLHLPHFLLASPYCSRCVRRKACPIASYGKDCSIHTLVMPHIKVVCFYQRMYRCLCILLKFTSKLNVGGTCSCCCAWSWNSRSYLFLKIDWRDCIKKILKRPLCRTLCDKEH